MEERAGGAVRRARWGTAVALTAAVVFLSAANAIPLVAIPMAVVLAVVPFPNRWKWAALGLLLWIVGVAYPTGPLGGLSRGWSLLLGGGFLVATLARSRWGVLPRSLLALLLALVMGGVAMLFAGGWANLDGLVRSHLLTATDAAFRGLRPATADSAAVGQFAQTARRVALLQWQVFPAILALQSLAALGLASWAVARLRRVEGGAFTLRPLREFRFNDQLVWVLILGLALLVLPLDAVATRLGYNALFFMGGLYALRGFGVIVFLAGGAPSFLTVMFGAIMAVFLYPLVLTAAFLVGLGDTWLDVRGRAAAAPPA
jgi:hypothetical protein